ncbi:MAG TPA: hypothetical protein VMP01_07055 [Pirellulaceae bacterium]|nr:hypothetical protein [Pirellulaceae bacterium]
MHSESVNPYEPPPLTPSEVTHHFTWRSVGTTLRVGIQERHEVTIRLDWLTSRTLVLLDGQIVRAFRYFFDPPPIHLDVGEGEPHRVEIHLVSSLIRRPSRIDVDGATVVPEIAPLFMWMIRVGVVATPAVVAGLCVIEYGDVWGHGDWFTRLLTRLAVALAGLLVTLVTVLEVGGLLRMKFGPRVGSKPLKHAPPRSSNAR